MLCRRHLPTTLALFAVIAFTLCVLWRFLIPQDVQGLHDSLLRIAVLGWTGLNPLSILLGAIEWAVWGWLAGSLLSWLDGACDDLSAASAESRR